MTALVFLVGLDGQPSRKPTICGLDGLNLARQPTHLTVPVVTHVGIILPCSLLTLSFIPVLAGLLIDTANLVSTSALSSRHALSFSKPNPISNKAPAPPPCPSSSLAPIVPVRGVRLLLFELHGFYAACRDEKVVSVIFHLAPRRLQLSLLPLADARLCGPDQRRSRPGLGVLPKAEHRFRATRGVLK